MTAKYTMPDAHSPPSARVASTSPARMFNGARNSAEVTPRPFLCDAWSPIRTEPTDMEASSLGITTKLTCRRDARGGLALEDKRKTARNLAGQVVCSILLRGAYTAQGG